MTNTTTKELGIIIENKRPVVSSRDVARVFEKEHFNVIRDIKNLECDEEFNAINFEAVDYTDAKGEKRPMYLKELVRYYIFGGDCKV